MPDHFRKHGISEALSSRGFLVEDLGDVPIASFQRHNNSAIRNFPAPQMVWERTENFLKVTSLQSYEDMIVCIGGDCSIVVGTIAGISKISVCDDIHILYLDGDVDSIAPDPKQCMGSAGMGLWLLTQKSEYQRDLLTPSQITVIGNKEPPKTNIGVSFISLESLRINGKELIQAELERIPKNKQIFIHLDVDILSQADMPAAYAPREDGLSWEELGNILKLILTDKRVHFLEITEFCPQKDCEGKLAKKLIETLAMSLIGR